MSSNATRTNLVLAAILIALGSTAYWYEFKQKPKQAKVEETSGKLLPIDQSSEIDSVQIIDKAHGVNIAMVCQERCKISEPNSKWMITAPVQFSADESNVETFVSSLASANVQDTVPLEGDAESRLKDFGLGKEKRDEARAVIKVKGHGEPYTVYFGDTTAVGENNYTLVTGPSFKSDSVRVVPGYVRGSLERNQSYWRAKRLFNFAASEVQGLKLTNPAGTVELARDNSGWVLMPGKKPADGEAVDTFVTGLAFTNATDYVADDKAAGKRKLGLSNPKYTVTIKPSNQPEVKLELFDVLEKEKAQPSKKGEPTKNFRLYAIVSDKNFVAEIDRTNVEKFAKKADAFRVHSLLSQSQRAETNHIEVTFPKAERLVFERDGAGWKLAGGKVENFDPGTVDAALNKLSYARAGEFIPAVSLPKSAPEASSWVLKDKAGKEITAFTVFATPDKAAIYVKARSGMLGGETAKMERGSGAAIPSALTDFQKPSAAAQPAPTPAAARK